MHYVAEGSTWESARARIGSDWAAGRNGRTLEPGPLLVFVQADHVVHTLAVLPPLHLSSRVTAALGPEAVLRAHSKDPGPYLLVLE